MLELSLETLPSQESAKGLILYLESSVKILDDN